MKPQALFADITPHGEACHAARIRLLDWHLTQWQYLCEVDENCAVYFDGPDLADRDVAARLTVTAM